MSHLQINYNGSPLYIDDSARDSRGHSDTSRPQAVTHGLCALVIICVGFCLTCDSLNFSAHIYLSLCQKMTLCVYKKEYLLWIFFNVWYVEF